MGSLDGRHVLVTGGGTGIGAAIARALAAEGCAVTVAGRRREPLGALAAELPKAAFVVADVSDGGQCATMAAAARENFGPLDIVVANAGAAESAPLQRTSAELWQRMIGVNLTGAFNTAQATIADLARPAKTGEAPLRRLVFVASTAGLKGYPYVSAYVAAKHGVIGLMRALAVELARTPVTVNAICPGFTRTALLERSASAVAGKSGRPADEVVAEFARFNPQGTLIEPRDVASAAVWLASSAAHAITGQAISVSGGEV